MFSYPNSYFPTALGESGSVDTNRDIRGFACKFYTEDGILDLLGLSMPMFFFRDPMLFTSFVHAIKRNPATHLNDADSLWDFITLRPEITYSLYFYSLIWVPQMVIVIWMVIQ